MKLINKYFIPEIFLQDKEALFKKNPDIPEPDTSTEVNRYIIYVTPKLTSAIEQLIYHFKKYIENHLYRISVEKFNSQDISVVLRPVFETLFINIFKNDEHGNYLNLFLIVFSDIFSKKILEAFGRDKKPLRYTTIICDYFWKIFEDALKKFKNESPLLYASNYQDFSFELAEFIFLDQLALFDVSPDPIASNFLFSQKEKKINARFLISLETYNEINDILKKGLLKLKGKSEYKRLLKRKKITTDRLNFNTINFLFRNNEILLKIANSNNVKKEISRLRISPQEITYLYEDIMRSIKIKNILNFYKKMFVYVENVDELEELQEKGLLFRFEEGKKIHKNIKNATVFFMDIRNFTKTSKHMNPDEVTKQLHIILDPVPDIVIKFGGFVDKMLGDGVMVLFGVKNDISTDEHALNAVRSAILLHEHFEKIKKSVNFNEIGIGINTGKISIAQFGQVTAIGKTVNKAARLCSSKEKKIVADDKSLIVTGPSYEIAKEIEHDNINSTPFLVTTDDANNLYNTGIAISNTTYLFIKKVYNLISVTYDNTNFEYFYDPLLKRNIVFRYAGNAALKGFGKEKVYEVIWHNEYVMKIKKYGEKDSLDHLFDNWLKP